MSDVTEELYPEDVPAEEDPLFEDELGDLEFADNPEPRCPVLIIADCSGSMAGRPIDAMNRGVDDLYQAVIDDEIARNRVEVALLSFSTEARVERDFSTVSERGKTNMRAGAPPTCTWPSSRAATCWRRGRSSTVWEACRTSGLSWCSSATDCPPAPMVRWSRPTSAWWTWRAGAS